MRTPRQDVLRKLGSCGKAAPGVELAIFDDQGKPLGPDQVGELFVRRYAGMIDGYFGDKEKTAKSAAWPRARAPVHGEPRANRGDEEARAGVAMDARGRINPHPCPLC